MIDLLLPSLYLILPAYIANTCPVIFGKLNFPLGIPIHTKLFGKNKTYRGFYTAYFGALLMLFIQLLLSKNGIATNLELINYQEVNIFLFAFLLGVGAVTGDLIGSFFKRRLGIAPGRPFIPFDQLDLVFGALLFLWPVYQLPTANIIALLMASPILHLLTNIAAYKLKLKDVWW